MVTDFDHHQQRLRDRKWTWDDMPFYDGPGTRPDITRFHRLDYVDVYERIYGRPIGANGIRRLREVALATVTGAENRLWDEEPAAAAGLARHGLARIPDLDRFRDEQEAYAAALERDGVTVHWIEGHGALHGGWRAHDLLIVRGGAIVPRRGDWNPYAAGHAERLSQWAFWNLNIPTLLTISGDGVAETGATLWLADDVYVVGLSIAYDEDGLAQLVDAVRLTAGADLEVLTVRCQGDRYFDRSVGTSAHVTNVLAPLDAGKVLVHPAGLDTATLVWLREREYVLVQVDPDEQATDFACDIVLLEPGRVVMPARAVRTIELVRAAGVEVVPVAASSLAAAGCGLRAATMEILRAD